MPYWCELSPGQQGRAANLSRNQHNSEKYQIFNQVCAGNCDHLQLKAQINSLVKVSVTQSCPTLWDPMACSLPGSSIHGILQARILEWVATSFFRGSSWPRIEPGSPASWADSLPSGLPGKPKFPGILWQLVFLHCSTSANAFPLWTNYCCSVIKSCLTLCDPMDCSIPGFPVSHHLPEFAQVHVHWMPPNYFIFCHSLLLLPFEKLKALLLDSFVMD